MRYFLEVSILIKCRLHLPYIYIYIYRGREREIIMILYLLYIVNTRLTSLPSPCFHPRSLALDIHFCNFTSSSIFQFPISPFQPTCFVVPWLYQALSSHYSRVGRLFSLTWLWNHWCLQLTLCRLQHFQIWKRLTNHSGPTYLRLSIWPCSLWNA